MVCHETYKDINGNWLYPEEIEKIESNKILKKDDGTKVVIGASESMSKSKKNTVDPETMINQYGADAVRWFILSDSPPEKDVQWSATGVAAANKFLQKIWDLNHQISSRGEKNLNKEDDAKLKSYFREILPEFDEDRVYTSDIKKIFNWYNLLQPKGLVTVEALSEEEKQEEESSK